MYIFFTFLNYCVLYIVLHMYVIIHKHVHVQYPSDKRYKAFCVSNAFKRGAKRGAKRVYYKRKMRVNVALHAVLNAFTRATLNAFAGNAFCERLDSARKLVWFPDPSVMRITEWSGNQTTRKLDRGPRAVHSRDVMCSDFAQDY